MASKRFINGAWQADASLSDSGVLGFAQQDDLTRFTSPNYGVSGGEVFPVNWQKVQGGTDYTFRVGLSPRTISGYRGIHGPRTGDYQPTQFPAQTKWIIIGSPAYVWDDTSSDPVFSANHMSRFATDTDGEVIVMPVDSQTTYYNLHALYPRQPGLRQTKTVMLIGENGGGFQVQTTYGSLAFVSGVSMPAMGTNGANMAGKALIMNLLWIDDLVGWLITQVFTVSISYYWDASRTLPIKFKIGVTTEAKTALLSAVDCMKPSMRRRLANRNVHIELVHDGSAGGSPYITRFTPSWGGQSANGLAILDTNVGSVQSIAAGTGRSGIDRNAISTMGSSIIGNATTPVHELMHAADQVILDTGIRVQDHPDVIAAYNSYKTQTSYAPNISEFTAEHLLAWTQQSTTWTHGMSAEAFSYTSAMFDRLLDNNLRWNFAFPFPDDQLAPTVTITRTSGTGVAGTANTYRVDVTSNDLRPISDAKLSSSKGAFGGSSYSGGGTTSFSKTSTLTTSAGDAGQVTITALTTMINGTEYTNTITETYT